MMIGSSVPDLFIFNTSLCLFDCLWKICHVTLDWLLIGHPDILKCVSGFCGQCERGCPQVMLLMLSQQSLQRIFHKNSP